MLVLTSHQRNATFYKLPARNTTYFMYSAFLEISFKGRSDKIKRIKRENWVKHIFIGFVIL